MAWLTAGTAIMAYGLCWALAHPRLGPRILDRPGARSLHDRPTPRTGGIGVLCATGGGAGVAALAGLPLWADAAVVAGALGLAAVSFMDDVHGLGAPVRLIAHTAAAGLLLWGGYGLHALEVPGLGLLPLGIAGGAVSLVFVVWMTNLYNFMDGMDGFAGGMGAIGFGALGLLAAAQGADAYATAAALVAGANLGFLAMNFPPARIFLGDVGSVPMGFLAAAFALGGVRQGLFPLWVPLLVFSVFVVDATVTLFRRLLRRERIWEAHRSHHYQRLVLLGWSHRKTTLASYVMMFATSATALLLTLRDQGGWALFALSVWAGGYLAVAVLIAMLERNQRVHRI